MSIEPGSSRRVYGATKLKDQARAILGDSHTHHHYYGALSTRKVTVDGCDSDSASRDVAQIFTQFKDTPPDLISDYEAPVEHWLRRESRISGTCKWIHDVPEYKRWRIGLGPAALFCTGSVGCGKSIAAAALLDDLLDVARQNNSLAVSYFVDTASAETISVDDILRALIKQLVVGHRSTERGLSVALESRLRYHFMETNSVLNFSHLMQIVRPLLTQAKHTYILLDGIDAMSEAVIVRLMNAVKDLSAEAATLKCHIVIFCREVLGRGIRLEHDMRVQMFQITLDHVQEDVHAFIDQKVSVKQDERHLVQSEELLSEIVRVLKANSAKMFLWAKLQIATIWDPDFSTSEGLIRAQLRDLPEGLDQIYIKCLRRIESTHRKRSSEIALKAFRWVSSAARPLTQGEACELVSLDSNKPIPTDEDVLSLPVTDYCCNLVVCNRLTGLLEFAHSTVRDFLHDGSKVPADLHRYLLDTPEAVSSCAEVCLHYIKMYRSRSQVVKLRQDEMVVEVLNPIPGSMLDSLVPDQARTRASFVRLLLQAVGLKHRHRTTPNVSDAQARLDRDNKRIVIHEYIRLKWLVHVKAIPYESWLSYFRDLCTSQDTEFLPWADVKASEFEKTALALTYAVTTNHVSLFEVIKKHICTQEVWSILRKQPCPGTSSSYLHIAAALGHNDIAKHLIREGFGGRTDEFGKSASAIAFEARQLLVFQTLFAALELVNPVCIAQQSDHPEIEIGSTGPGSDLDCDGSPLHKLRHWNGNQINENLLTRAVQAGDAEALDFIIVKCRCGRGWLSHAVFEACKVGNVDIARRLVVHGANQYHFYTEHQEKCIHRLPETSSLWQTIVLERPDVLAALFHAGASLTWTVPCFDVADIVAFYNKVGDPSKSEPFVRAIAHHWQRTITSGRSAGRLARTSANPTAVFPQRVISLILSYLDDTSRCSVHPFLMYMSDIRERNHNAYCPVTNDISMTPWLEYFATPDWPNFAIPGWSKYLRVLLDSLPYDNLKSDSGFSRSPYVRYCFRRCVSRKGSLAEFLSETKDDVLVRIVRRKLMDPGVLLTREAIQSLCDRRSTRALEALVDAHIPRQFSRLIELRLLTRKSETTSAGGKLYWTLDVSMFDSGRHHRETLLFSAAIKALRPRWMCTRMKGKKNADAWVSSQDLETLKKVTCQINEMKHETLAERFTLLRCYLHTGHMDSAIKLFHEMKMQGSDAQFALNHPLGLTRQSDLDTTKRILHAVYSWNYRIRRKSRLSFSQADVWYLASLLKDHICYKSRDSAQESPAITSISTSTVLPAQHLQGNHSLIVRTR